MIQLDKLDRKEAVRYLGGVGIQLNYRMDKLLDECEELVLLNANPKYLYLEKELPFDDILQGNDIKDHLAGCEKIILFCATIGAEIDKLIRISQITDMAKAVVLDSFASVAIEQLCNKADKILAEKYKDSYLTFRFSPGYGDYPLELQREFLNILDAPRKIGLTVNDSFLLTPTKSVTAIIGISPNEIERKKRGCATCNMRGKCLYVRKGEHCGF